MDFTAKMDQVNLDSELRWLQIEPNPGERVFEIVPKHFGRMFVPTSLFVGLTAAFIITLIILANSALGTPIIYSTAVLIMGVLYLVVILYLLTQWYVYRRSALVFTNQRIMNIEYRNIFSRQTKELDITLVQNAYGKNNSTSGKIFNYGTLFIDRIGHEPIFFNHVPFPQVTAEQVLHFHNLVAHGADESAHNYLATTPEQDETPEIEHPAEKPVNEPESSGDKPKEESQDGKTNLRFEAPSDKVGQLLKDIGSNNEPKVSYLAASDSFEIEATILPDDQIEAIQNLKSDGAKRITIE